IRELNVPESEYLLDFRNEAIACLALSDVRLAHRWEGFPEGTAYGAFDLVSGHYARSDAKGNVTVRRIADDREVMNLPGTGRGGAYLGWSPQGRFLAVNPPGGPFRVWDIQRGAQLLEAPFPVNGLNWTFSRGGRRDGHRRDDDRQHDGLGDFRRGDDGRG